MWSDARWTSMKPPAPGPVSGLSATQETNAAAMQASTVAALALLGVRLQFGLAYFLGIAVAGALFVYQQRLIRDRKPANCFAAFRSIKR